MAAEPKMHAVLQGEEGRFAGRGELAINSRQENPIRRKTKSSISPFDKYTRLTLYKSYSFFVSLFLIGFTL